jgi:hypothetical protein
VSFIEFRCDEMARGGSLLIDSDSLHTDRWCVTNLTDLWEQAQRGDDTEIAGYDGVIPFARRFAVTRYLLPLTISGWVDENGDLVDTGQMAQLRANITDFKAAFVGPGAGDGGEREIVYLTSDGETWTSDAQVTDIRKDTTTKGWWTGNLELTLLRPWVVT